MKQKMKLYPIKDCMQRAEEQIRAGAIVHQQFTCAKCKSKQTIEKANTFYATGACEECKHITNMEQDGCNFMLTMISGPLPPIIKDVLGL